MGIPNSVERLTFHIHTAHTKSGLNTHTYLIGIKMNTENKSHVIDSTDVTNTTDSYVYDYSEFEKYQPEYLKAVAAGYIKDSTLPSTIRYWTHEPNQPLIGTIIRFDEFEHPRYGKQQTVIVERDNSEVVSAILPPYLQRGMAMQDGEIGDLVFIEKEGQEQSKYGKTFNKFKLVIDKQF